MDLDTPEARAYLFELYTVTKGDTGAQASMHDVGAALGLEKADAAAMAESLMYQGFAELKTLSGGIGITAQGLEALDIKVAPAPASTAASPGKETSLGRETVLGGQSKKAAETMIQDIKAGMAKDKGSYAFLEEMVMDIKTIEVQMLSPRPKTAVIREVFQSMHDNFIAAGDTGLAAKLKALIAP